MSATASPSPADNSRERPTPTLANWFETCDWGHCNGQSYAVRWADDLGAWLAVCRKHRARGVVLFDALPEPDFTDDLPPRPTTGDPR